jgi:transposase
MINSPSGTHIWLAAGITDMRRSMDGLAALVQFTLELDPSLCDAREYVVAKR